MREFSALGGREIVPHLFTLEIFIYICTFSPRKDILICILDNSTRKCLGLFFLFFFLYFLFFVVFVFGFLHQHKIWITFLNFVIS